VTGFAAEDNWSVLVILAEVRRRQKRSAAMVVLGKGNDGERDRNQAACARHEGV